MPTLDKSELIAIRAFEPGDRNFVLATWLRGLYFGSVYHGSIDKDSFMVHYHQLLEGILGRCVIQIACLKDDADVILGYSVLGNSPQGPVLHWVHCKKAWRNIGLAKSLVPEGVRVVSHLTKVGSSILKKHHGVKHNPFAL